MILLLWLVLEQAVFHSQRGVRGGGETGMFSPFGDCAFVPISRVKPSFTFHS